MMHDFRLNSTSPTPGRFSGLSVGVYAICKTCGVQGHTSTECYNGPSAIEHANGLHGFQPPPQYTSQFTAYNQGLKSYSYPPYKNPNSPPQNAIQPPGFQYRAPYNPPPNLHNPNQIWRVSWSNSWRFKLILIKLLVHRSTN